MITPVNLERLIETPRMILEPLKAHHAAALYQPLQSLHLYQYIPGNAPDTVEFLTKKYQFLQGRTSPDGKQFWLNWVGRSRQTREYIGTFEATVREDSTAHISYQTFAEFCRQGYAREGCKAILKVLFTDHKVKKITAETDTRNTASYRLLESLGFKRIREILNADFFKGSTSHEYLYELNSSISA